jgi:hypothetical protein
MPTWRTPELECRVQTFAEGMLSPLAHDLEIDVGSGSMTIDEDRIEARFDAGSLSVVGTVKGGRTNPEGLSPGDYRKIEKSIQDEVLHGARHPEIRFAGTLEGDPRAQAVVGISGELDLHGARRPLHTTATREGERWVAEVTLHQPDFGIRPYKAMMGTLKVKAHVRVRISVPMP